MKDKLIEQALKEHKIVRYIPTFVSVLETYRELIEADNKQRIAQLEEALKMITKGAEMASHEFDDPNDATEAFSYLNICIEQAKSILK